MEVAESATSRTRTGQDVMVNSTADGHGRFALHGKVDLNLLRESAGAEKRCWRRSWNSKACFQMRNRRDAAFGNLYGMDVYVSPAWPRTTRLRSTPARTPR